MKMNISFRQTAIGRIGIAESGKAISLLLFEGEAFPVSYSTTATPLLDEAFRQLDDWLSGRIRTFTLPLLPVGSTFMLSVWRSLLEIPYGETRPYNEVAAGLGNPKASRAVGMACGRNPLPVFIPCHRVVRSDGELGGYRGGPELKRMLLGIERRNQERFDVKTASYGGK